jgi:hypothetical protein
MDATAAAVTAALTFVWVGMVLAISFLEAPLKFRAPGVTIPIGLGIGRLVFRALNIIEAVLAVAIIGAVAAGHASAIVIGLTTGAVVLLAVQIAVIRPGLSRRTDQVLAGTDQPRSRAHLFYVAAEIVKAAVLVGLGISALAR